MRPSYRWSSRQSSPASSWYVIELGGSAPRGLRALPARAWPSIHTVGFAGLLGDEGGRVSRRKTIRHADTDADFVDAHPAWGRHGAFRAPALGVSESGVGCANGSVANLNRRPPRIAAQAIRHTLARRAVQSANRLFPCSDAETRSLRRSEHVPATPAPSQRLVCFRSVPCRELGCRCVVAACRFASRRVLDGFLFCRNHHCHTRRCRRRRQRPLSVRRLCRCDVSSAETGVPRRARRLRTSPRRALRRRTSPTYSCCRRTMSAARTRLAARETQRAVRSTRNTSMRFSPSASSHPPRCKTSRSSSAHMSRSISTRSLSAPADRRGLSLGSRQLCARKGTVGRLDVCSTAVGGEDHSLVHRSDQRGQAPVCPPGFPSLPTVERQAQAKSLRFHPYCIALHCIRLQLVPFASYLACFGRS